MVKIMMVLIGIAAAVTAVLLSVRSAGAAAGQPPLVTVPHVDLQRYVGKWYEIARLDHSFQRGCVGSNATYTLRPDGEVEVLNRCTNEQDGKQREAKGRAWSVDPVGNARLKVSFFWPFRGDYWIIELGEQYDYSVVGAPNRKYLWVLARTPQLDETVYRGIVERAGRQGFPVEQLVRRPLPPAP